MEVSIRNFRRYRLWACILLYIFLMCFSLSAKVSSIAIGTGNDWITMGLGNNKDDGHSFSFITDFTFDSGAYFRFFIEGITDQQSLQPERYGSATLVASYPIVFANHPSATLSVTPHLGATLVGEIALEGVQNFFHKLLKRDLVSLPSAFDVTTVYPYLGVTLITKLPWRHLLFDFTFSTAQIPAWESEASATFGVTLNDFLSISAGYAYQWNHSDSSAQMLKAQQYRGPLIYFTYDAHLVKSSWFAFLTSEFSYGYFTFNPLALGMKQNYEASTMTVLAGITYDLHGLQTRLAAVRYKDFSLTVHYSNGALASESPYRRNIGAWSIGKLYSLQSSTAWLRPSIQPYLGVKRLNLVKSYTEVLLETARPVYGVQLGLALGKAPGWIIGNTAYQFRLLIDFSHTLYTSTLGRGIPAWESTGAAPFSLLFGLVLEIGHDLYH